MKEEETQPSNLGVQITLFVGLALLGAALYVVISGGEAVVATILTLVAASALSGCVRARRAPKNP